MNLGFVPKGRPTIRKSTPSNRSPRWIEPWAIPEAKAGSMLAKLEAVYLSALEAVDQIEARKAEAIASKKFTAEGITKDALGFAASKLAPKLKRARLVVEGAKAEAAALRGKLVLKPAARRGRRGFGIQFDRIWPYQVALG
jgi:hypothetical protein